MCLLSVKYDVFSRRISERLFFLFPPLCFPLFGLLVAKNEDVAAKNEDAVAKNGDAVAKNGDMVAKNGDTDDSNEGTRHFMVNVIEPQFNLHSEDANVSLKNSSAFKIVFC